MAEDLCNPIVYKASLFRPGRILGEISLDAVHDGIGNGFLMGCRIEFGFFLWIGNESGFNQDAWDIRGFQDSKSRLLDMGFVQGIDFLHFFQDTIGEFHALLDLTGYRHINQHTGNLAVLMLDIDAPNQVRGIFTVGKGTGSC